MAIDDFGTGYAGLQYLQAMPLDIIKIDRSFILAIGTDSPRAKTLDAVIGLAKEMHLEIIAEGVETLQHAKYLSEKGVTLHQGWLYSKAVSLAEIEKVILSHNLQKTNLDYVKPVINKLAMNTLSRNKSIASKLATD